MQSDPLFWHRTLDRRRGVVIPFPVPKRDASKGERLPPYQAALVILGGSGFLWSAVVWVFA